MYFLFGEYPFRWRTEDTNTTVQTDDTSQETAKCLFFHRDGVDLPTVVTVSRSWRNEK